jgi:PPP family 3-phenylpropionic acid transporter
MDSPNTRKPRFALARFSAVYVALFAPIGILLPCMSLFLNGVVTDVSHIGAVMAIGAVAGTVGSHVAPAIVDRIGRARLILVALSLMTCAFYILLDLATDESTATALFAGGTATASGASTLVTGLSVNGLRGMRIGYAMARSAGSMSAFALMLLSGAVVSAVGIGHIPLVIGLLNLVAAASYALVPGNEFTSRKRTPVPLSHVIKTPGVAASLAATALLWASHAGVLSYGPIFWQDAGYSPAQIGAIASASVPAEVVGMILGGLLLTRREAPEIVLATCCAVAVLRWLLLGFVDLGYGGTMTVQTMHGLTFGLGCVAGIHLLSIRVPPGFDIVTQGLQTTLNSLMYAAAVYGCGFLHQYGPSRVYGSMAVLSVLAICSVTILACVNRPQVATSSFVARGSTGT